MGLKPGEDPRQVLPRHAERGAIHLTYTLEEIAQAAGVTNQTVRKAVSQKILDAKDLRSVAAYIQGAVARKSKPLSDEEVLAGLPEKQQWWWSDRWPHFELYACPYPECGTFLFGPGSCAYHGGDRKPQLRFDPDWHVQVLVGKDYVPLHRLIAQTQKGLHTHHRDANPWNNRWFNLEALTPEEHSARHVGGSLGGDVVPEQPARIPLHSEVGGFTKAALQELKDREYLRGFGDGEKRGLHQGLEQAAQTYGPLFSGTGLKTP